MTGSETKKQMVRHGKINFFTWGGLETELVPDKSRARHA